MSRRIRRGRRGIDLPLKNPPASTDRVIGHDANGAMFQATIAALTSAVLGNISVVENANGISVRVPTARVQICAHLTGAATLNEGDTNSGYRTPTQTWTYPQPFSSAPHVVGSPVFAGGHIFGVRLNPPEATLVNFRIYGLVPGAAGQLSVIAIGRY